MVFKNFQEAYLYNMENVYYHPQFINAPRGNKSKECLNLSFVISNPRERVCYISARKSNIIFNFAEALWYLSGSNDLDFISYYASNMKKYSMDGKTLTGTAYGKKIFSYGADKINQWDRILQVFQEDKDSKRGFISIFDTNENLLLNNIDVSCTIGLQFFERNKLLYMSTFMRANDAYRGILSDVFSFTFIHEVLATQLGLGMGDYCHNVATTHIYESDNSNVERVLADKDTRNSYPFSFPRMPEKNNWDDINMTLQYEKKLRLGELSLDSKMIRDIEVSDYWKQIITLFAVYQKIKIRKEIDMDLFYTLETIYQYFIKQKWQQYFRE